MRVSGVPDTRGTVVEFFPVPQDKGALTLPVSGAGNMHSKEVA